MQQSLLPKSWCVICLTVCIWCWFVSELELILCSSILLWGSWKPFLLSYMALLAVSHLFINSISNCEILYSASAACCGWWFTAAVYIWPVPLFWKPNHLFFYKNKKWECPQHAKYIASDYKDYFRNSSEEKETGDPTREREG